MKSSGGMQSFFSFMAKHHHFIEDMFRLGLKSEWIISESELYNLMRNNDKDPEYNKKYCQLIASCGPSTATCAGHLPAQQDTGQALPRANET